jgi:hypothetical protein
MDGAAGMMIYVLTCLIILLFMVGYASKPRAKTTRNRQSPGAGMSHDCDPKGFKLAVILLAALVLLTVVSYQAFKHPGFPPALHRIAR